MLKKNQIIIVLHAFWYIIVAAFPPVVSVSFTTFVHDVQAHPFWETGTGVEVSCPSTPHVIVPTEAEVDSAVQVRHAPVVAAHGAKDTAYEFCSGR